MKVLFISDEGLTATENMQKDVSLMNFVFVDAYVRFYTWSDRCVTYGYNQKRLEVEDIVGEELEFAKRPTGGGLIIHTADNFSWSLLLPLNVLENNSLISFYYKISEIYAEVLNSCGVECSLKKLTKDELAQKKIIQVCADYPAKYELVDNQGNKIIGSAQRKTRSCLIQQNNLFISIPDGFKERLQGALTTYFS